MGKDTGIIYGNLNFIREIIFQHVMTHEELLKFIHYHDTDTDITKLPNLTKREKNALIDTKVFKRRRFPATTEKADVMLSMEYGSRYYNGQSKGNSSISMQEFVSPKFCFNVIVHETLDETDNGSRLLAIEHCLLQLFHNQRIGTLGVSYISQTDTILCPQGYIGITVTMKFTDFIGAGR